MYVRPENFSGVLNDQLNAQIRKLAVARRTVQQAIDVMLFQSTPLATSGTGRDNTTVTRSTILSLASIPPEYEYEKSPRWRAWYDLNLGRLLYQSVRIDSYIALASEMTSSSVIEEIQKNEFNSVLFRHSTPVASSSELTARASLGRQLLERVVEQHPDTPWSQLALWELEHPPGFTYKFGKVPPPKPVVGRVILAPTTPSPRIPRL
jgi:hypothetical protein